MQVKILGCGTSTGVPVPSCQCTVCNSSQERNQRLRSSVIVSDGNGIHLLIDTATDFRQQALRWRIPRIDAVLYTHSHADHILGLEDLRGYNFSQKSSIPAYGTEETLSAIRRQFHYVFEPDPLYIGGGLPQVKLCAVPSDAPFQVRNITIHPFPLQHGYTTVTGFRIGSFAYATDCNGFTDKAYEVAAGASLLIIDGLRYEPHKAHFTIPEAIAVATRVGAKRTLLTHMTHTVDYDEVSAKLPAGVELAYDGLTVEFAYP
jgi:phosphoribosyl 1,2-cyclic phosphate phosphodiesterase